MHDAGSGEAARRADHIAMSGGRLKSFGSWLPVSTLPNSHTARIAVVLHNLILDIS